MVVQYRIRCYCNESERIAKLLAVRPPLTVWNCPCVSSFASSPCLWHAVFRALDVTVALAFLHRVYDVFVFSTLVVAQCFTTALTLSPAPVDGQGDLHILLWCFLFVQTQ
jgi:hypothetical protein